MKIVILTCVLPAGGCRSIGVQPQGEAVESFELAFVKNAKWAEGHEGFSLIEVEFAGALGRVTS